MAKKNYFDNDAVTKAILEYQETIKTGSENIKLLHPYTTQLQQLIRGVINTHKIYRWWDDVDELVQEGMLALFASFRRFDSEKGTAFNYLSIVVKQHLKNWTQSRNKKTWMTNEFHEELHEDLEVKNTYLDTSIIDQVLDSMEISKALEPTLQAVIDAIIEENIDNKRDVVRHLVQAGWKKENVDAVFDTLENHLRR